MDIFDIYKKHKKAYKKEKSLALLDAMKEIDVLIKKADINTGFIKLYKFYKILYSFCNIVVPGIAFGLATGVICSIMDSFVTNIKDIYLLTVSNLLFVSMGVVGVVLLYLISWKHTMFFILIPYATNLMEDKIKEYNKEIINQQTKITYKVKVKRKRRQKLCQQKRK